MAYTGYRASQPGLEKVPANYTDGRNQKKRILGEAKFLRAWAYFYAVRLWGDIPIVTTPQTATSEDFYPERKPQEEVYKLIVQDLIACGSSRFALDGCHWQGFTGCSKITIG